MISYLSRHLKKIFSALTVFAVLSMLFFGMSNSNIPTARGVEETVYKVGSKGHERTFSARRLENMKTFLKYDHGYGFNDALECQNIFSDGFCLDLMDSQLGRAVSEKYFSLIKDDFEEVVKRHRGHRLYRHPSGKLTLLNEMKRYGKDLYAAYEKVQDTKREIDVSLFHDYISLATEQRKFRPCDMKKLMYVFARDQQLGQDPILDRKNFALFHAKSNADIFGDAFLDVFAQVVMEGAAFARDHGYSTSYEEASGIIRRLSAEKLSQKYPNLESDTEIDDLQDRFRGAMGLSKSDLVVAARDMITILKMISDVDSAIVLDKMVIKKLYSDNVENLLATVVQDHPNMYVNSIEAALELDCYLEALGERDGFLSVPRSIYGEEELYKKTPQLFMKNYTLKIASRATKQVADTVSLKDVSSYQVSDAGWEKISKKFSFKEDLAEEKRFGFIRALEKGQADKVDSFSRLEIVSNNHDLVKNELETQELVKGVYGYNNLIASKLFGDTFDDKLLIKELDKLSVNEELSCYSQDGEQFYRVMLLGTSDGEEFATFDFAKKNGYLTAMVDQKLRVLNKGAEVDEDKREALLGKLVRKLGGRKVFDAIEKAVEEKKFYSAHSERRLNARREGDLEVEDHPLLNQFVMYDKKEVISRVGGTKELALESYFKMQPGDKSPVAMFENGLSYYISLIAYKYDEEKLEKYVDYAKFHIAKEARDGLFKELVSHFERDNMIARERFEKGA